MAASRPVACLNYAALQYMLLQTGGIGIQGLKAMTVRTRPMHCKFETLRLALEPMRSGRPYHRCGSVTNEQLTARVFGRISRPIALFTDLREA